jgi:tRNA isopentenyl-2-thiomethyl-A-37 hydroxylase MiaE
VTELDESITAADVTSRQLLQAVKGFLAETVTPALNDRDQFNARVAANVIGIVQREQALGPTLSALDSAAFKKWVPDGSPDRDVVTQISQALAKREIQPDAAFLDYLKQRQLLLSAINNPRYANRVLAAEKWRHLTTESDSMADQR